MAPLSCLHLTETRSNPLRREKGMTVYAEVRSRKCTFKNCTACLLIMSPFCTSQLVSPHILGEMLSSRLSRVHEIIGDSHAPHLVCVTDASTNKVAVLRAAWAVSFAAGTNTHAFSATRCFILPLPGLGRHTLAYVLFRGQI